MTDTEFTEAVDERMEEWVEEVIHDIRAEVTIEMAPLYEVELKKRTGHEVEYGEEGFDIDYAWTEDLIEAAQDVQATLQGEFDYRVAMAIRDYKNDHVEEVREEIREELRHEVER